MIFSPALDLSGVLGVLDDDDILLPLLGSDTKCWTCSTIGSSTAPLLAMIFSPALDLSGVLGVLDDDDILLPLLGSDTKCWTCSTYNQLTHARGDNS
ncbi:hypothetical protein GUJ93_ZPchr0001g30746 [Zizania palustris]|uniref:Uncharacterized protein n=1 Tax=Zizania palustris TaxID=103762 RepID=A0A8J5RPC9_ZIZPA|nr:hypothetical protein GUJ93_ZPchr0001g30746 [Zizania palustris]